MLIMVEIAAPQKTGKRVRAHRTLDLFPDPTLIGERSKSDTSTLIKAKLKRVNLLHAAITHQERRVIRGQPYLGGENIAELRSIAVRVTDNTPLIAGNSCGA